MSGRTRMLGAGCAGSTAHGVNVNLIQFGDKLQGLAPQATHFFIAGNARAGWHNYQTRTYAPKKNYIFCMNRLGGVGRGKSQFKIHGVNNPDSSQSCNPYEYDHKRRLNKKCCYVTVPYSELTNFDNLSQDQQDAAKFLGYDKELWDIPTDYDPLTLTEFEFWENLEQEKREAWITLGWDQRSWNAIPICGVCPQNMLCMPKDYWFNWNEIELSRQRHYITLGFSQETWDKDDLRNVLTESYSMLSKEKKDAVDTLCYTQHSWDAQRTLGYYDIHHNNIDAI